MPIRFVPFLRAIFRHLEDGCARVALETFVARLTVCNSCSLRQGDRCLACGCIITTKARWRSESCPAERWPR